MGGRRRRWSVAQAGGKGHAKSNVLLVAGVVGILGGLALLGYGLAPAKDLWDAVGPTFSGGPPPEDLGERMDASMDALKARVMVDALGFVAMMAGIVLAKMAFAAPKEAPLEKLVEAEVARRMALQGQPMGAATLPLTAQPLASARPAAAAPSTATAPPVPARSPASAPAAPTTHHTHHTSASVPPTPRRTHCGSCGSVLVAGGRICPQGHAQA